MSLPPGHCVKLESLAGCRGWPHLPPCSNTCPVSTGGCALQKKSLSCWTLRAERSHRHQGNDQQAAWSLPPSTGTYYPCSQVTECHTSRWRRGSWDQWPAARPLSSCSEWPAPRASPAVPAEHTQGFSRLHSAQHHLHGALWTPSIFTEGEYAKAPVPKLTPQPISQTSFWLLHVGFSVPFWERDGAMNRKNARNGLSYRGAPVLSPKMW